MLLAPTKAVFEKYIQMEVEIALATFSFESTSTFPATWDVTTTSVF